MEEVREKLKEVIDPHTGINIVDMGMVKEITQEGDKLKVVIKPTSPFCPVGNYLIQAVKEKVKELGYDADVELEGYLFGEG
ncbi:metal-sulfur cluster assembly factor [Aquifex sp.]